MSQTLLQLLEMLKMSPPFGENFNLSLICPIGGDSNAVLFTLPVVERTPVNSYWGFFYTKMAYPMLITVSAGIILRLWLHASTLGEWLSDKNEVSTPLTSWKRGDHDE